MEVKKVRSEICLIRHGITEGNYRKLYYGGVDIPLIEEGYRQLKAQREEGIYPQYENVEYYTSGMIRTEQTLATIFGDVPHEVIGDLREINFGAFEMKHFDELKEMPEYWTFVKDETGQTAPEGGECMADFKQRILAGFEELKVRHFQQVLRLRNQEKMAASIAVIHGGPICAIMDSIWPDRFENFYYWTTDPGHGYKLILEDGGIKDYEAF